MPKLGREYENVLADVLRLFHPKPEINVGDWIEGPDGQRELDVFLKGTIDGRSSTILIECKDYRRHRRIGIDIVDAFDSKLRDLIVDVGIICANCDFSKPARAKAKRLNINLIGVLSGQNYSVMEYYEQRVVRIRDVQCIFNFSGSERLALDTEWVEDAGLLDGGGKLPELAWEYVGLAIDKYPIVNGTLHVSAILPNPAVVDSDVIQQRRLMSMELTIRLKGAWLGRYVEVTSDSGVYNWLTRSLVPVGAGNFSFGKIVDTDPKHWIKRAKLTLTPPKRGVSILQAVVVYGLQSCRGPKTFSAHLSYDGVSLLGPLDESATVSISRSEFERFVTEAEQAQAAARAGSLTAPPATDVALGAAAWVQSVGRTLTMPRILPFDIPLFRLILSEQEALIYSTRRARARTHCSPSATRRRQCL